MEKKKKSNMTAMTESLLSDKLSPPDRLARKRAAARLRQQRCRARKRQSMLEQRRQEECLRQVSAPQDSTAEPTKDENQRHNPRLSATVPTDIISSHPREPIYNCVSFDSQRSFEEAQRALPPAAVISRSSSVQTSSQSAPNSPPSTGKPFEVVTIPMIQPEERLVAEEEAAVAAMLSLKSGSGNSSAAGSPPSTTRRPEDTRHRTVMRVSLKPTKYRFYPEWEAPPRYSYVRHGQGHGPPPPAYYCTGMPHRVTPPHYCYYPAYTNKGYSRFDYE